MGLASQFKTLKNTRPGCTIVPHFNAFGPSPLVAKQPGPERGLIVGGKNRVGRVSHFKGRRGHMWLYIIWWYCRAEYVFAHEEALDHIRLHTVHRGL